MAESKDELKSLLKVKEESEKVGLKLNIQKTKIMASRPFTPWEIDGETVETVLDFIFGAPKSLQMVTAAMQLKDAWSFEKKLCTSSVQFSHSVVSARLSSIQNRSLEQLYEYQRRPWTAMAAG